MNANELADELDKSREESYTSENLVGKAATMLRQQQAEINALKKEAALQRLSDFTQEAEHEPVAWIKQNSETLEAELHFDKPAKYWATVVSNPDIPLYTHPANLTSLEIADAMELVFGEQIEEQFGNDLEEFARAILRKAQEK